MNILCTVWSLLQNGTAIAIALFGIGFLIGFHELGHFLFCKLFGIKTPTFSIGFGPVIFSRHIWGTDFTLSAIPLGGFVEIAGTAEIGQGEQKDAQSRDKDSFAVKPYWQKFLVMTGGIMCNLLFAYIAFIALSMMGIPKTTLMPSNGTTTIETMETGSAAERGSLQPGDTIQSINTVPVKHDLHKLIETVQPLANQKTEIVFERAGKETTRKIIIGEREGSSGVGSLGISFEMKDTPSRSFFDAIKQGITLTNDWIARTVTGFISIFRRADMKSAGGPVAIISMLSKGATTSFKIFLILLAILSINLAILNLIPLPILDGGQLLFYTIEAIAGRPLPLKVREYIHIASWLLVLGLILYITVYDVARIAHPYVESIKQFLGFGR